LSKGPFGKATGAAATIAAATIAVATTTITGSNAGRDAVAIRAAAVVVKPRLSRKINLMPKQRTDSSTGARPRARQKAKAKAKTKTKPRSKAQSKPANRPADETQLGALMSKSLDLAEASLNLGLNFVQRLGSTVQEQVIDRLAQAGQSFTQPAGEPGPRAPARESEPDAPAQPKTAAARAFAGVMNQ